jgi:hypothetical protein
MTTTVGRRQLAEHIGAGLLGAVVVGSGIAATRLLMTRVQPPWSIHEPAGWPADLERHAHG